MHPWTEELRELATLRRTGANPEREAFLEDSIARQKREQERELRMSEPGAHVDVGGLRAERRELFEANNSILDRVKSENRNLTASEQRLWKQRERRFDDLTEKIEAAEGHGMGNDSNAAPPLVLIDREGREHRTLGPGETFANSEQVTEQTPQELRDADAGRFILGAVVGRWRGAEKERELHRTLSSGELAAGGIFLPSLVSAQVVDLARSQTVLNRAGVRTLALEQPELTIVKVATDPTAVWRGERQTITESEPTFAGLTLKAKSCAVLVTMPRELAEDSPNAADAVKNTMTQAIALEWDRAGLFGLDAALEPSGAYYDAGNTVDVGQLLDTPSANGGKLSGAGADYYSVYSHAVEAIRTDNIEPRVAIHHPRELGTLDRARDSNNDSLPPLPSWQALTHLSTTSIPQDLEWGSSSAASAGFVGNWSSMLQAVRMGITIEATTEAAEHFAKHEIAFKIVTRLDYGLIRPNGICRVVGILAE